MENKQNVTLMASLALIALAAGLVGWKTCQNVDAPDTARAARQLTARAKVAPAPSRTSGSELAPLATPAAGGAVR